MVTQICRFHLPGRGARLGQVISGTVYDLTASGIPHLASLAALLRASNQTAVHTLLQDISVTNLPAYAFQDLDHTPDAGIPHLLAPVDRQEVWAAGVTYTQSREARIREAQKKDIYAWVYSADRPELFFKSTPEKVVGPNDWVGVRGDSCWSVPEPELALVLNPAMQIVGYTIGNDLSSRDIEGENPLYLPQAKVYRHACALGPVITLADEQIDPGDLNIRLTIKRGNEVYFQGEISTAQMHRTLDELVSYLARYNDFPEGVVLLTGTGIVPDDEVTLQDGDWVIIEIEGIGILRNWVKRM